MILLKTRTSSSRRLPLLIISSTRRTLRSSSGKRADMAVILVGPKHAVPAVEALATRGCSAAIVLAGGFAEAGDVGSGRQQALTDTAGDMRILSYELTPVFLEKPQLSPR